MGKKILIVEDNDLNRKLFEDLLVANGYTTLTASDGATGLDLARRHRPDLIVVDILLPEISGLEVSRQIRDDPKIAKTPIIAVTAFAASLDEEPLKTGGYDAIMTKPISIEGFLKLVSAMLA